jgi:hypothetical protein
MLLTAVLATLIGFSYWNESTSAQRTESLEILDADGNPRIVLAVDGDTPTLRIIDQHGTARIEFEVRPFWDVLDNRDERAPYALVGVRARAGARAEFAVSGAARGSKLGGATAEQRGLGRHIACYRTFDTCTVGRKPGQSLLPAESIRAAIRGNA